MKKMKRLDKRSTGFLVSVCFVILSCGQTGDGDTGGTRYSDNEGPVGINQKILHNPVNTWTKVVSSPSHTLALKNNTLWAWGTNEHGQLGDGTYHPKISPVEVGRGKTWIDIAAGDKFSIGVAVAANGEHEVYTWGYNGLGQLGLGHYTRKHTPQLLTIPNANYKRVVDVAAGNLFSMLVVSDTVGTGPNLLYTWGSNTNGELGIGVASGVRNSPQQPFHSVTNTPLVNVIKVAAGGNHALAIVQGTIREVFAWGLNDSGQVGHAGDTTKAFPVYGHADDIAAGTWNSIIRTENQIKAWGLNLGGSLCNHSGGGTIQTIDPLFGGKKGYNTLDWKAYNFKSISAGLAHTLFVADISYRMRHTRPIKNFFGSIIRWETYFTNHYINDALLRCGNNDEGQMGIGNLDSIVSSNIYSYGATTGVESAFAGEDVSFVLKNDGTLWGAGYNMAGHLGDNTVVRKQHFVEVASNFTTIDGSGSRRTMVIGRDGRLWITGAHYVFVNSYTDTFELMTTPDGKDDQWASVAGGEYHFIALRTDGSLWGHGRNNEGQLGLGSLYRSDVMIQISPPTTVNPFVAIAAGRRYSLAIKADGTLWAWGANNAGQLGIGTTEPYISTPTQVGTWNDWVDIDAGNEHTIGRRSNNTIWSWGLDNYGQLGHNPVNSSLPSQMGTKTNWVFMDAGYNYNVAIDSSGFLYSWGHNSSGQLGVGDYNLRSVPAKVNQWSNWLSASAGYNHTFGVRSGGNTYGWGNGVDWKSTGFGVGVNYFNPVLFSSIPIGNVMVVAGYYSSFAIQRMGLYNVLFVWGKNDFGELGSGYDRDGHQPFPWQNPIFYY